VSYTVGIGMSSSWRRLFSAVLVVTALCGTSLVVAQRAATADTAVPQTYGAATSVIANPDRGMYHYTETHYRPDGSGYVPLDAAEITRWRTQENVTLVYRIFFLEKFVTQDIIDAPYLMAVQTDLSVARAAGVKLVVRFAYADNSPADAPPARVLSHIRQLVPVLNANADVISTLEAGFVGQWGEWYYTNNFASDPARPWVLSDADWAARTRVLTTLLDTTNPGIFIQVRYPSIKQHVLPDVTDPRAARVGIHNDCFVGSADDYGTFPQVTDHAWLAEQTQTVPMGGESCAVDAPRSQWYSASADLAEYHWSYLNADFNTSVLDSWGTEARTEAARRLGYRLRLTAASLPTAAITGADLSLHLTLTNDGYAAPWRPRPVQLVMTSTTNSYTVTVPVDVREFTPGTVVELPLTVPAPPEPGTYALHLAFPDPSPRLATQPAYSIQLADTGMWDSTTGWNDLHQSVEVSAAPAAVMPAPTGPAATAPPATTVASAAPLPTSTPLTRPTPSASQSPSSTLPPFDLRTFWLWLLRLFGF